MPYFVNPTMLFGLSALSIPIIIHLLNRRKFQRVVWAAMRFLRISVEQNRRRMRIEDLLLLILRCLLLASLALALAQPVLGTLSLLGAVRSTAVLVLDNSYSMSQSDGVMSRFEAGKRAAAEILRSLPPGSSSAVLLVSDRVEAQIPEPTFDLASAERQIRQAPLFDRGTDLLAGLKAAFDVLEGRPAPRREVFLITDGQATGFRQFRQTIRLIEAHRRDVRVHVLIVGQPEDRNLGISQLRLDEGLTPVNVPIRLEARVRNYGRTEARDVTVSIAVDDSPPMDQAMIQVIPSGQQRSVSLFARLKDEGYHVIVARIDGDRLPADDFRAIAVRAVRQVKVLLIDGESGSEPRDSEVFFLRAALQPVPLSQRDTYFIQATVRNPAELEAVRFEDFDAVVSANVTDFSQGVLRQLAAYVRGGGALLLFVGDRVDAAFYNEQLYGRFGLLPARIGAARGDALAQDNCFRLQDRGYEHPIVGLWADPAAGSLSSARFFRVQQLLLEENEIVPGRLQPSGQEVKQSDPPARVVVRFQDGSPAMIERDLGAGRVILFASTADTAWNDLGVRAGLFVPLMHRTLGRLVARQDEHLTIPAGQAFIHTIPIELAGCDAVIRKAARPYAGSEDPQELRQTRRVEMVNNLPTLRFAQTDRAGGYEVMIGQGQPIRFAVQSDPEESSPGTLSLEQYEALGRVAQVVHWQPGISLRQELQRRSLGTELWLPLAVAALVLAGLETLLAHWFSKPK